MKPGSIPEVIRIASMHETQRNTVAADILGHATQEYIQEVMDWKSFFTTPPHGTTPAAQSMLDHSVMIKSPFSRGELVASDTRGDVRAARRHEAAFLVPDPFEALLLGPKGTTPVAGPTAGPSKGVSRRNGTHQEIAESLPRSPDARRRMCPNLVR